MSSCYDIFDQLYTMSSHCHQLLITTHWYGFYLLLKMVMQVLLPEVQMINIMLI